MLTMFSFAMVHAGWNFNRIAFSMFRFMTMSLAIGILMGVAFKPRSWCVVCPMGTGTSLIMNAQKQGQALKPVVNITQTKTDKKDDRAA